MATIEELQEALAQAEIELADKAFYVREFAAVCQERDALKAERDNLRTGWENSHRAEEELERAKAELHDAKIALDGKEVQIAGLKLSDKAIARELAEAKAELHDWKIGRYRAVVPGPEHCGIAHGVVVEPVRVPSGIAAERQATVWSGPTRAEAEKKWNEINTRLASSHLSDSQDFRDWLLPLLPETRVEDGTTYRRNPANDGFVDMPTDAKVEALAMALCDATCETGFWDSPSCSRSTWTDAARAAFAHIGAVDSALEGE